MTSVAAALVALALAQAQAEAPPEPTPAPTPIAQTPAIPSLLSGETLKGTSLFGVAAGWPRAWLSYAQGVSRDTDLGLLTAFDYTTTEFWAGGTYRGEVLPNLPPYQGALRLSLAWYHDSGSTWLYKGNHVDDGVYVGLGVSYSRGGQAGLFSLLADVPITVTFAKDGGVLVNPKASFAYEMPLYGPITVGVQVGLGLRFGYGYAPQKEAAGEFTLLGLASYRVL